MNNKKIAGIFDEIADILDIKGGENSFRINAYRRAAITIYNMGKDLRDIFGKNPDDLEKIPGIGKDLKEKIIELIQNGECAYHEKLKKGFPKGLLDMLHLRGVGPKKVKLFYGELGIKTIKELKKAAETGALRDLEGMGEKSEAEILKSIEEFSHFSIERALIHHADNEAAELIEYMKKCKEVKKIEYAGSLRRRKETIGDIDILVTAKDKEKVMDHFVKYREVLNVIAKGDTKSSIVLESGMDVDLRVVDNESFGAAMHYFTGNKEHNIRIRDLAKKKKLKINEYGVFKGKKMVGGKDEKEIFKAVGLPYIIPEIRRNDGEIEYGLKHKKFPRFVELKDIKGDLHSHTNYSDGEKTLEEMVKGFIKKGYEYFSVSDHSSVVKVAGGMGTKDIRKQWKEVDKLNKKYKGKIKIFKSSEVDILKDGSLDFPDDILKELDIVIASVHTYMRLPEKEQTARIITAIENPHVNILGHPSGRLINKRPAMEFNMEKIIDACVKNNVAIEINSHPQRLDLNYRYVKVAKEKGAKIAINTDSHSISNMDYIKYGVSTARRGWLTKNDVINTQSLKSLTLFFK